MPKEALYRRMFNSSHAHHDAKHGHVTERDVTSRKCIYRFQSLYSIIYGVTRVEGFEDSSSSFNFVVRILV